MTWDEALKNARGELGPSAFDNMQQRAVDFKHDGYSPEAIAEKLGVARWTIDKLLGKRPDRFKRYYFHYSTRPLAFDKFKPVGVGLCPSDKPKGFWLSVETVHDRGWWGFLEERTPSMMYRTRFGVNPGRLLTVASPWDDDIEGLAIANPYALQKLRDEWDKIRQQWNGIIISNWERNLSLPSRVPGGNEILHSADYKWWALLDASSACIWDYRHDTIWQIGESVRYHIGVDEHFIPLHESAEYRIVPRRVSRIDAITQQELGGYNQ